MSNFLPISLIYEVHEVLQQAKRKGRMLGEKDTGYGMLDAG